MIELHRLGHDQGPFHLNPDLIVTVESNPDTTISLTTGTVSSSSASTRSSAAIRDWRAGILAGAYSRTTPSKPVLVRRRSGAPGRSPLENAHEGRQRNRNRSSRSSGCSAAR